MNYDLWKTTLPDEPEPPEWWLEYYALCDDLGIVTREITYADNAAAWHHLQHIVNQLEEYLITY